MKIKKTILTILATFMVAISFGQYKLLLSPNVVELRNNTTDVLIRKYSNVISVYPSPTLSNFIRINNNSEPYDINFATIARYSINGGAFVTTFSLNGLIEDIQSTCVVRVGGGSSGVGSTGDASAVNQLVSNVSLASIDTKVATSANQVSINSNLIDIKANTLIQKGSITQNNTTITVGGTAQTALSLNTSRTGFEIINNSVSAIYINLSGTANLQSIKVNPNASYSRYTGKIPTNEVSVLGTITGQEITILESN